MILILALPLLFVLILLYKKDTEKARRIEEQARRIEQIEKLINNFIAEVSEYGKEEKEKSG